MSREGVMRKLLALAAAGAVGAVTVMLLLGTAWTSPRTWAHQELVTASILNQHVRDNLLHLKENVNGSAGWFRGLDIRTHPDADKAATKVQLLRLDQAVVDNGLSTSSWAVTTADLSTSGANGLDTGSEAASTWYELYGIHKSSDGTKALLFHRAKDNLKDEEYNADDTWADLRRSDGSPGSSTHLGQGFKVDTTGPCPYIDVEINRGGTLPANARVWLEIQSDSSGLPSNTVLVTSDLLDATTVHNATADGAFVRFIFRVPYTLTAATQYHAVLTGDWAVGASNRIEWRIDSTSATYANGGATRKDTGTGTWSAFSGTQDFSFRVYIERNNTSVTMPSGYDGKILLGYVHNNASSNLVAFRQREKHVHPLVTQDIGAPGGSGTAPILVDMAAYVPPVAVNFGFWLRNIEGRSFDIRVGPIPDGYGLLAGHRSGGESRLDGSISGGDASELLDIGQRFDTIITETQALYVRAGAGTIDALIVGSWEW